MAGAEFANENWWEAHKVQLPTGQLGHWALERYTVRRDTHMEDYAGIYGHDCPAGEYTRLVYYADGVPDVDETMYAGAKPGSQVFMTDTPGEIGDHHEVMAEIRRRGGRVLIHGLGLGMIVKFALAQPNVTHVDVVELDSEVINLVGRHYRQQDRLTIHHGDALKYQWPPGMRWSVVWHDIWGDFLPSNLKEMEFLHRCFAQRCDWQGSWSKDHLLARRRAAGVR